MSKKEGQEDQGEEKELGGTHLTLLLRAFKGLIRPFKGLKRPFKGLIRPLKGLIRPFEAS